MTETNPEPPGPDTSTDAGDVDQDAEPSTTAPPEGAPDDSTGEG